MSRSLLTRLVVWVLLVAAAPAASAQILGTCRGRKDARPACPPKTRFASGSCEYTDLTFWQRLFGYRAHCALSTCNVCTDSELLDEELGLCCSAPVPPSEHGFDFLMAQDPIYVWTRPQRSFVLELRGFESTPLPGGAEPELLWSEFLSYEIAQPTGTPAAYREIFGVSYGPDVGARAGTWYFYTGMSGRPDCIRAVDRVGGVARDFTESNVFCPLTRGIDLLVRPDVVFRSEVCGVGCDGRIMRLDRSSGAVTEFIRVPRSQVHHWWGNFAFDRSGTLFLSSGNSIPAVLYRVDDPEGPSPRFVQVYLRRSGSIMGFDFGPDGNVYFTERTDRVFQLVGFSRESLWADFGAGRQLIDIEFRH